MELVLGAIILAFIIYFPVDRFVLKKDKEDTKVNENENEKLPYKLKDDFLTDTERSFYHILKLCVGERAVICPKVGLKDIFFIGKGIGKDYMKYFGKIAQKHIDFLLCDPSTMKPLCGIELDDIGHTNKKNYERDLLLEKIYKDANFELIRVSSKSGYAYTEIETALNGVFNRPVDTPVVQNETVLCPKCCTPMVLRKVIKGANVNKAFYGCPNYPQCKEVINKDVQK